MATTDVSICNGALIMVGANDINSFSDNTIEAKLCNSIYGDTKRTLLQYHPWRFSLKQFDLGGALVAAPEFDWDLQYQLPPDLLRIIRMKNDVDYEIFGEQLYTNEDTAEIIYQYEPNESDLPSYFIRALQFHLARVFSMSLQEDSNKMQIFDRAADKETARARQLDAQSQPNMKIPEKNFSLINVRQ